MRLFQFDDGRNVLIEADTFEEAVKIIKEQWWSNVFEECSFTVTRIYNAHFKSE